MGEKNLAHYFDALTGSAFYSAVSLHPSAAALSPVPSFKPKKHLKDDVSVKSSSISCSVSLIK